MSHGLDANLEKMPATDTGEDVVKQILTRSRRSISFVPFTFLARGN